ncbi:serine/threonine protein kinase [Azospirillum fermentarium]|uniref:helix-hairpin-helix domain-containing protein n=1 Tax=Azospirillum fermentarium TaxID=1233114 RepID=UPI00222684A3|nr:lipopolysaccharide kinase InaA family protein [Azospirillum fermentarium]MCW2244651.1 serine/threonine protein kinase [Azospirillum fermentarium]
MAVIKLTSMDGQPVEYEDEMIGQGGMKDVFMSPDRSYVVAFFRDKLDYAGQERIKAIVGPYRQGIFEREGGDYWKELFCWPTGIVDQSGRLGIVVPAYRKHFLFEHGSVNNDVLGIKGKEKEGKWFASASNRAKFLDPKEKGDWLKHLQICLMISRAVRRLHAAGLAHSDLSYKNVLVDPSGGKACVIDIDGLVVPNKFPPDVVGTPDFIAPEVIATQHLDKKDQARKLPSTLTDRHALAVLIYMYLFYRHPLRGAKVHDTDASKDEELSMGMKALFVEHPTDKSNRVRADHLKATELPWADPARMPYTIAGPLLAALFEKAFIEGLHDPQKRPTPSEWENALVRTIDMIQPCSNKCEMGWYVFDNSRKPKCPFCGTPYQGKLPVLNLYSSRHSGTYQPDNHRVMVWNGQSLFPWHVNRKIFPNEHLTSDLKKRVGYFQLHQGDWYLVNEGMPQMHDIAAKKDVPIGGNIRLSDGSQYLLSRDEGGRLIQVQLVEG